MCFHVRATFTLFSPKQAVPFSSLRQTLLAIFLGAIFLTVPAYSDDVRIGNFHNFAPNGIAFIVDDSAGFVIDLGGGYVAGIAAPDNSYQRQKIGINGAHITFEWGRVGDAAIARLTSDKPVQVTLALDKNWPGFQSTYTPMADGVIGKASVKGKDLSWTLKTSPAPITTTPQKIVVNVAPDAPAYFVAGLGALPDFATIDATLAQASLAYEARRPKASGDWGDFLGAISDNVNNSRIYSSDNHRLAHCVSRRWARDNNPNRDPYFCWDSFFTADLASLDDPKTARDTVRAILSEATPEGFVPNFGHWPNSSLDRSQPPDGAMCVWKIHQRWPDLAFLREVYPALVEWHRWWFTARDGNHDGLLEWGSTHGDMQDAQYETGWDDTIAFTGTKMVGHTMNADAVDLNSLYATDAQYLARIADALDKPDEAASFRNESDAIVKKIRGRLWNNQLGIYCSRMWGTDTVPGDFLTRLTPMNFYPLIAGVPTPDQARSTLAIMTDPKLFWGDWVLPTTERTDPVFPQQNYWHGKVWGPVNYFVFQGLQEYAPAALRDEFADKSVRLFMHNWTQSGLCGENYLCTTGAQSSDPHYTWGALLCLIGLENICNIEPDNQVKLNGVQTRTFDISNVPLNGRLYDIHVKPGQAELWYRGRRVLSANNREVLIPLSRLGTL